MTNYDLIHSTDNNKIKRILHHNESKIYYHRFLINLPLQAQQKYTKFSKNISLLFLVVSHKTKRQTTATTEQIKKYIYLSAHVVYFKVNGV